MGCDIHCYIEYRDKGSEHWNSFGGKINPGRDYDAFARLAGVRNYGRRTGALPPRGRLGQGDCGWAAYSDSICYVSENGESDTTKRSTAERWVKQGSSVWTDERKSAVTNPDWHSHTWLSLQEWKDATVEAGPEYHAMTAAMASLENDGYETRVVMWFDN